MAATSTKKAPAKKTSATPAKKTTAKKTSTTVKKVPQKKATTKKVTKKAESKPVVEEKNIYNTNVSILLAMAIEALILLLGYLIIMSVA